MKQFCDDRPLIGPISGGCHDSKPARSRSPSDADPELASDPDDARHERGAVKDAVAWKQKTSDKLAEFLAAHMVPVINGLKGEPYLIDHHHLARALYEEG